MNRKQRLAVILLIVAIILATISIMIKLSINSVEDNPVEKNNIGEPSSAQGTVQLIVQKFGGENDGEG